MRSTAFTLILLLAVFAAADEADLHRAAVVDKLLREMTPEHRAGTVFVRMREQCWDDPAQREGCVDLSDEALRWLRRRGHKVARVPEASRYYIYGHPSTHAGEYNPPPPDWLYLPVYTPGAELRTYCEVELMRGLYAGDALHINGRCYAATHAVTVLASGDFLVRVEGRKISVERFQPPPGCILPEPR
jgi:hypothetical protein